MELDKELLIFMLQTINLHRTNRLTLEQLQNLTVNQFSSISEEDFIFHFEYLADRCYLSYHNTLKHGERYVYDLGLTFYGTTALKQHIDQRPYKQ